MGPDAEIVGGSFRDPAGLVFTRDGVVYRQLHEPVREAWTRVEDSGLLAELWSAGQLVEHETVDLALALDDRAWRVIRPDQMPFIAHPYEWSVAQLADAARLTLDIQAKAILRGLTLKDASAYNVQFHGGRAVFIDTLSLEPWQEGQPWTAYQQFCRHFLAPLALARFCGPDVMSMSRTHIDGPPLPLTSALLPWRSWLSLGLLTHVHLHARSVRRYSDTVQSAPATQARVSKNAMLGLVDNLRGTIDRLDRHPGGTEWGEYYAATNYSDEASRAKEEAVDAALERIKLEHPITTVWDLGANTGRYSRIAARHAPTVVAWDVDQGAVDAHWRAIRSDGEPSRILPLVQDLSNPSPALGWAHEERSSFEQRGPVDVVMALALIHHLAISNNVPLPRIIDLLARLGRTAIVEMVPKEDSQVQRLLATREDIFPRYHESGFEAAARRRFDIVSKEPIPGSHRILYTLRRSE